MKTSTKDKIRDNFQRSEENKQGGDRKGTNDRNLKAEGKAEKKAGKVQQRIGHDKEGVAKLKEQLADLKNKRLVFAS
jgi:uncharacterized protein YjbJ (UPF0337 family)